MSQITTDAMPKAEMAGITLMGEDGRPNTGILTDPEAPEIDVAQYESGQGPCLDSWRSGKTIRLDDLKDAADEYPEFAKVAQAHGIKSTLSLPLIAGDQILGALKPLLPVHERLSSEDEAVGMELAAAAAIVLANANAYWEASQLSEQLGQAMQSRAVIEQAKGILMARSPNLTPDDAFDFLRKASQRENVKLRQIAQRIVERNPSDVRAQS